MNTNTQKRIKSIIMWLGIIASAFMAIGIDWHEITSWIELFKALLQFLNNPSQLILFAMTAYSIANNPTDKSNF